MLTTLLYLFSPACTLQLIEPTVPPISTPGDGVNHSAETAQSAPVVISKTNLTALRSTSKSLPSGLSGRLAYIGNDGNVYVALVDAAGTTVDVQQVTRDATTYMESQGRSYHRLAWSRDGWLAFAAMDRSIARVGGQLYVVKTEVNLPTHDESAPENTTVHNDPKLLIEEPITAWFDEERYVIYLYWSPNRCEAGQICSQLAFLEASKATMGLRLVDLSQIEEPKGPKPLLQARRLQTGRPFYFGWSSNGENLAWHINGSAQWDPNAAIGLYNIKEQQKTLLALQPGSFLSPAWSPATLHKGLTTAASTEASIEVTTGAQWLAVILPEDLDATRRDSPEPINGELRLFEHNGSVNLEHSSLITQTSVSGQYVWSPKGGSIAYTQHGRADGRGLGLIHLYSLENEAVETLTLGSRNVSGFFWSPDGYRMGYVHALGSPDPRWVQWRTVQITGRGKQQERQQTEGQQAEEKKDRGFRAFRAGFGMRFMLGSFSQYAQSHRYWSPDGRYLLYVDEDISLVTRIWLVDTQGPSDAKAKFIAEGSLAVWEWGP